MNIENIKNDETESITIYVDGSCKPVNPNGYGCYGWTAYSQNNNLIAQDYGFIGFGKGMSNNHAEYTAIVMSLKWVIANAPETKVEVLSESKLVVFQINGIWECRAKHLTPLRNEARRIIDLTYALVNWEKKLQNKTAHALSNLAYCEAVRTRSLTGGGEA